MGDFDETNSVFFTILFLTASIAGLAQGTTSRISGVATDASGAVVPNAVVTATNDDTGISYSTKTSASGTYSFDSLQIGRYTVRAEAPGFGPFVSTGNVLAIGVPTSIDPKFREEYLEFRLEAQNVFNVITYDTFGSQSIQSTSFTRLNPAVDGVLNNSPRKMQLSAKYVF